MPTPFLVSAFSPTCFERAHSIRESVVFLCSRETFFSSPLWFHVLVVTTPFGDRKSTRLNSSHGYISYAVFCLKKKKIPAHPQTMTRLHRVVLRISAYIP